MLYTIHGISTSNSVYTVTLKRFCGDILHRQCIHLLPLVIAGAPISILTFQNSRVASRFLKQFQTFLSSIATSPVTSQPDSGYFLDLKELFMSSTTVLIIRHSPFFQETWGSLQGSSFCARSKLQPLSADPLLDPGRYRDKVTTQHRLCPQDVNSVRVSHFHFSCCCFCSHFYLIQEEVNK